MQCPICPTGRLEEGTTTLTLERDGTTIVMKAVPANVCDTCGEATVEDEVASGVEEKVEALFELDVLTCVCRYE